jgi:hypothetical protein
MEKLNQTIPMREECSKKMSYVDELMAKLKLKFTQFNVYLESGAPKEKLEETNKEISDIQNAIEACFDECDVIDKKADAILQTNWVCRFIFRGRHANEQKQIESLVKMTNSEAGEK